MKRLDTYFTMIAIAMLSFTFTSCDIDDEAISYDLEGVWEGEIISGTYNRYGDYSESYTDVQIEFYENPYEYAKGGGREIDFDYYGRPTDIVRFNYAVRNGIIYMDYYDGSKVEIRRWNMWGDRFEGDFHDYRTGEYLASFRLYRVDSWGYGYSLAKTRGEVRAKKASFLDE